jgi:hypothetical protein
MNLVEDKTSFFVKGSTIIEKDNKFFPGDDDSSDSDNMIGGLGSKISKDMAQESTIFSHPSTSSNKMFDSFDDSRNVSVTVIHPQEFLKQDKEEEKVEDNDSFVEDDAEIQKGDDFTDSDEEDLTIRFSKVVFSGNK